MKLKDQKNIVADFSFDAGFKETEQLPKKFAANFESVFVDGRWHTKVTIDGIQLGDIINDNTKTPDDYRFHDVFHFSFATILGWSPCTRSMMKRKRKSDFWTDDNEDGARATITEEFLSLFIFKQAKRNNYFEGVNNLSRTTLRIIKDMTDDLEVHVRTPKEWEKAILKAYEVFRFLKANNGGEVRFDAYNRAISYSSLSNINKGLTNIN